MKRYVALMLLPWASVVMPQQLSGPGRGYIPAPDIFQLPPNTNSGADNTPAAKGTIPAISSKAWRPATVFNPQYENATQPKAALQSVHASVRI